MPRSRSWWVAFYALNKRRFHVPWAVGGRCADGAPWTLCSRHEQPCFEPFYDLLDVTPLFLQDGARRRGGSGHPDPDFRCRAVNNPAPSPTARRAAGAGSTTTSDTPTSDPSAPADTAAARKPARTS